jgi:methyl-accepting chemotaxis protein
MKRVLRDIYRHHKHVIGNTLDQHGLCLSLAVVYVGSHLSDYDTLERLYIKLQKRLIDAIAAEAKNVSALTDSIAAEATSISPLTDSIASESKNVSTSTDLTASDVKQVGDTPNS